MKLKIEVIETRYLYVEFWPSRWWRIFLFLIITTIDEYNSYVMSWLNGHWISDSKTNLISPNIIEVIDHLTDIISFRIQYTEEWMNLTMWNCLYLFFIFSLILGRKPYFLFFPYNPSLISLTVFLSSWWERTPLSHFLGSYFFFFSGNKVPKFVLFQICHPLQEVGFGYL